MLNIYKASAGSGKTHTLTRDFLLLSFADTNRFMAILAVTFTNKAAGEMKERIISELFILSNSPKKSAFFDKISQKFNISEQIISKKAQNILKKILHNYANFNISTIDSFVQRIIRAFAFELRVPASYNIEMDYNKVAQSLADNLLMQLFDNKILQKWLVNFAEMKINDDKKWDFRADVIEFAKQLFTEKFYTVYEQISADNQNNFVQKISDLELTCNQAIAQYFSKIKPLLKKGAEIIENTGFNNVEGSKLKALRNFFTKNLVGKPNFSLNKTTQKALENNDWWRKTDKQPIRDKWDSTITQLADLMELIIDIDKSEIGKNYHSALIIKKNLYNFGIIDFLYKLLPEFRDKNNSLLISDLTVLLKHLIGNENNDAPFIYEKVGNKFINIMIDEFQDTSDFQWINFSPLIKNALADGNYNLVVGDVKQSIYRWRNGNWRLLHSEIKKQIGKNNLTEISLDTNWRSKRDIVLFNNSIFSVLPQIIQEKIEQKIEQNFHENFKNLIPSIYADVVQKVPEKNNKAGYVQLNFFQDNDWKDTVAKELTRLISDLLEEYQAGDIAILVRTNANANDAMQILLEHIASLPQDKKYNVISAESLLLINSIAINLIINVLNYILKPNEILFAIEIAINFLNLQNIDIRSNKIFDAKELNDLRDFLPEEFIALFPKLHHYSLFELVEKIISLFNLTDIPTEIPFIRAFQEQISVFVNSQNADIASFLEFWETSASNLSVQLSEIPDAVQIMTIHKSKGLAFKVVIMPYIDWSITPKTGSIIWTNTDNTIFNTFTYLPVTVAEDLNKSVFANDYIEEVFYSAVDALNMLYVAFTRAKDRIYGFSKTTKKGEGNGIGDFISKALNSNLSGDNIISLKEFLTENDNNLFFELGETVLPDYKQNITQNFIIDYYPSFDWTENIAIISHSDDFIAETVEKRRNAMKYGIFMHSIFEQLNTFDDLDFALNKMLDDKKITQEELIHTHKIITELFENQQIKDWFSPKWTVSKEREILTRYGDTKIPDRVISDDKQIIVIDYKFGSYKSEHKRQVRQYMKLLSEIYTNKKISGFLLYVEDKKIIEIKN